MPSLSDEQLRQLIHGQCRYKTQVCHGNRGKDGVCGFGFRKCVFVHSDKSDVVLPLAKPSAPVIICGDYFFRDACDGLCGFAHAKIGPAATLDDYERVIMAALARAAALNEHRPVWKASKKAKRLCADLRSLAEPDAVVPSVARGTPLRTRDNPWSLDSAPDSHVESIWAVVPHAAPPSTGGKSLWEHEFLI